MVEMKLRNLSSLFNDIDLYTRMLSKMKVGLFPSPSHPPHNVKPIPGAADAVAYYPGCSLHSTSPEFNISTKAVCEALGLKLIEPHGWTCCGSTPAHRSNPEVGLRLPMENLALFERSGFQEVTMPCAACFNHFKTVQLEIRHNEQHRRSMAENIGYVYQDKVKVNTLVQTIKNHVSKDTIAEKIKKPLYNLPRGLLLRVFTYQTPPSDRGRTSRKSCRYGRIDRRVRCSSTGLVIQDRLLWCNTFAHSSRYRPQAKQRPHKTGAEYRSGPNCGRLSSMPR